MAERTAEAYHSLGASQALEARSRDCGSEANDGFCKILPTRKGGIAAYAAR